MKRFILSAAILSTGITAANAQDHTDALRFSMLSPQGTARSIGFGNALGSVGADFTSLSVNPAGVALYRRGEFSVTPSIRFGGVDGQYLGETRNESYGAFNIGNLGFVGVSGTGRRDGEGWHSIAYGFGINRMANFSRNYSYSGINTTSSGSEALAIDANSRANAQGDLPLNSLGDLGYQGYVIDRDSLGYYSPIIPNLNGVTGQQLRQTRTVNERGGINEIVFSVGGNYSEKFMVGATLGLPIVNYRRDVSFTEADANGSFPNFESFTLSESLRTTGAGINAKFGIIVKPVDAFRFGASIHTPTWYSLTDQFSQRLVSNLANRGTTTYPTDGNVNEFSYSLRTPWRSVLSGTAFLGNVGFISADYEYVDYKSARFNFNTNENQYIAGNNAFNAAQQIANDSVRTNLKAASNFRIGGEAHMGPLYFRAGYGIYGNPLSRSGMDAGRTDVSAGVGLRSGKGFVDFGFIHTEYAETESPYVLAYGGNIGTIAPTATIQNKLNNLAITFGVKF